MNARVFVAAQEQAVIAERRGRGADGKTPILGLKLPFPCYERPPEVLVFDFTTNWFRWNRLSGRPNFVAFSIALGSEVR